MKNLTDKTVAVGDKRCRVIRLLGHGKGGYSYLAECEGVELVLKQIHHEPCSYYSFGDKICAELNDYERLNSAGIRIPRMIFADREAEIILKEYIDGKTVFDMVRDGEDVSACIEQVRLMSAQARRCGLNIDWFPTNFVFSGSSLWYIDYECNEYMDEWSFENWGIKYWSKTPEFLDYLQKNKQP